MSELQTLKIFWKLLKANLIMKLLSGMVRITTVLKSY